MQEWLAAKPAKRGNAAQQENLKGGNKETGEKKLEGHLRKKFSGRRLSD